MLSRWFLLVLTCRVARALPATYDQRQTGDVNVQVHVKDVQVLALLDTDLQDDYTEYDYIYDYADFTLKPMKPTTEDTSESSSEATEKTEVTGTIDSSTESSTPLPANGEPSAASPASGDAEHLSQVDSEGTNETSSTPLTEKPGDSGGETPSPSTPKTRINDKTRKVFKNIDEDLKERNITGLSTESTTKRLPRKRCRTGYSPDGKGRCRRLSQRRLSLIPLAMKFGPKLLDDLALSTRDVAQKEVHRLHSD